jgi:electron transport complex protein RnfB
MHTVIEPLCTGCELCIPVCPVDCISLENVTPGASGWQAWSQPQANEARERHAFHRMRVERARRENEDRLAAKAELKLAHLEEHTRLTDPEQIDRKRAVIEAALARARQRRGEG